MVAGYLESSGNSNEQNSLLSPAITKNLSRLYQPSHAATQRISLLPIESSDMVSYMNTSSQNALNTAQSTPLVEVDSKEVQTSFIQDSDKEDADGDDK